MTKELKACFVVPFWRTAKDDICVEKFIKSAKLYDMSKYLYFIIDSEEDRNFLIGFDKNIKTLLVSEDISKNNNNIPTIKKFYGIEQLYDKYDYIAAIDCDSLFLRNFNPFEIFDEIWTTKSCFFKARQISTGSVEGRRLCAKSIGLDNNYLLKKETDNFVYNIWFSDIPVYKSSNLKEFFDWIHNYKLPDGNTAYNNILGTFECFDYLVYWYWLISYKGLTSDSTSLISNNLSLLESILSYYRFNSLLKRNVFSKDETMVRYKSTLDFNSLCMIYHIETIIGTHWTARNYDKTKNIIPNNRLCMQIHCDRLGD